MKKTLLFLAFLLGIILQSRAYDFEAIAPSGQTLRYNIVDGKAEVAGYQVISGSLTIPSSVTYNGTTYSVTSIGYYAFYGCSGLTGTLTIPNSITSIGERAFYYCIGLTEMHSLNPVPPTINYSAFEGVPTNIPVYIPCGRLSYYTSAQGWSSFTNFIEGSAATFSAVSNDNTMGTVQVLTMPTCTNPQAVIYASANSGYRFDHWSDGNTANPRVLTVTEDTELTGYFVPDGGGTQGIDDKSPADGMKVYSRGNRIVVETVGASTQSQNDAIMVYDVMGRVVKQAAGSGQQAAVEIAVTSAGVYMVKVGERPTRKVVVR